MELTLDQALQKGVEAHRAGKVQEADRYYTAILKANSKHPDANHNIGVLAVGVGKVETALPFFKTAIEANPKIEQFWLSYIDALIKLDRMAKAKAVFDQAKNAGIKGDGLDQIEHRLGSSEDKNSNVQVPPQDQLKSLANLYTNGHYQEALHKGSQLLRQFPNFVKLYNIIGAANQGLGKLDDAVSAFQEAIKIKPDYADAYNNMGIVLKHQGKLDQAIEAYTKTLSIRPDFTQAYNNMGNALKDQGELGQAIEAFKKALSIKPDYAEACNNMGLALHEQGKLEEAIEAYTKAISLKPRYANAYNNMGNALQDQGELDEAIETYTKAISIKPDYAEAYNNMGATLQDQRQLDKAIEAYTKAISLKPNYADAYNNMGNTLKDQNKLDQALEAYTKVLTIKPDYAETYYNMGNTLRELGKLEEAIDAFNKALSIKPYLAIAHRNLSDIKKYTKDDKHFRQVIKLYKRDDLNDDTRCNLSFALAKMYEDIGKLDQSYDHLSKGNALRKKLLKYSINQDYKLFAKLKNTQPHLLRNSLEIKEKSIEATPIFIIGMPRSGTTLVEQIISSHYEVAGAGELSYIAQFGGNLVVDIASINNTALSTFRNRYLSELTKIAPGKHFVTDKMPQNFRCIPLICAALPEAKIIHVQRSAAATCWSNYKQYFVSKDLGYCYDLSDIVDYYNLYKELMNFYQADYSDQIYNLNYENLTTDQENQTRKLINHLELTWEEACLSPHKNKRSVRTASQQQVRQKVYQGSSEAWRKYEPYLDGAFDSLKSA